MKKFTILKRPIPPSEELLDELEAIKAIYGEFVVLADPAEVVVQVDVGGGHSATIELKVPAGYPNHSSFAVILDGLRIHALWLIQDHDLNIKAQLAAMEGSLPPRGQPLMFELFESVREHLQRYYMVYSELNRQKEIAVATVVKSECIARPKTPSKQAEVRPPVSPVLTMHWVSAEPFTDRRSTFQGHCCYPVHSEEEVRRFVYEIKQNSKIASATHNILAYRLSFGNSSHQDHDSDGESAAGGRLQHLLHMTGATDVAVMVTRWYGGIQLGADRFKHINNAARMALELANVIERKASHTKKK